MIKSGRSHIIHVLLAGIFALVSACGNGQQSEQPPAQSPQEPPAEPGPPPAQPGPPPSEPQQQGEGGETQQGEQSSERMAQTEQQPTAPSQATSPQNTAAEQGGDMQRTMQAAGCFSCHAVDRKVIGPAYAWVAHRYQNDPNAAETLSQSIVSGSQGKWTQVTGGIPMPPNTRVTQEQAREMAQWILEQEPQAPPG